MESKKKYGVYIGRFQPFHEGHRSIIEFIENSGFEPVIGVGESKIGKKLISTTRTVDVLNREFKNYKVKLIPDRSNDLEWGINCLNKLKLEVSEKDILVRKEDFVFFVHEKEEDKRRFVLHGKEYFDSYACIFEHLGFETKRLKFVDHDVSGTEIRNTLEKLRLRGELDKQFELLTNSLKDEDAKRAFIYHYRSHYSL